MCQWYRNASYCIAYLDDTTKDFSNSSVSDQWTQSGWFQRGWTLQELLAPKCVILVDFWTDVVGHKCGTLSKNQHECFGCHADYPVVNKQLSEVTGIPSEILFDFDKRHQISPQVRVGWMRNRRTTRPEDIAYSLLGLFDIFMPLLYGEGIQGAQRRLLQEIVKLQNGTAIADTDLGLPQAFRNIPQRPTRVYSEYVKLLLDATLDIPDIQHLCCIVRHGTDLAYAALRDQSSPAKKPRSLRRGLEWRWTARVPFHVPPVYPSLSILVCRVGRGSRLLERTQRKAIHDDKRRYVLDVVGETSIRFVRDLGVAYWLTNPAARLIKPLCLHDREVGRLLVEWRPSANQFKPYPARKRPSRL
jgi:hypothetical protein